MRHVFSSFLILILCTAALADGPAGKKSAEKAKRKRPFTIGKETTYVTGPVDKDGYIDYAAALNEQLSKGVTPGNNANVLLWKALGPHPEEGRAVPADYFKKMGMTPPPERGDYFTGDYFPEMDRAASRPWKSKQYPRIVAWLKANDRPLDLVVEATKRPCYFAPIMVLTEKNQVSLFDLPKPGLQSCRVLANALAIRAMGRVGEGNYKAAWQDLLACHRLGRLIARGGTMIEYLVGVVVDGIASYRDQVFLARAKLDKKQIMRCLRDLQSLPPMPAIADQVDLGERFIQLATITWMERNLHEKTAPPPGAKVDELSRAKFKREMDGIDFDAEMRTANRWFSRLAAALRLKNRAARESQLDQLRKELDQLVDAAARAKAANKGAAAKATGERIAEIHVSLFIPSVRKVQQAADRTEQIHRNLHVAFALAAYHSDHGRYPKTLDKLAPKYLKQVPLDLFSDKALIYRPRADGYLLYSVGVNGRDEQGRSYEDDPPGDDLPVRMPLPKLRLR
jgi:hypothetical protein